MDNVTFPCIIRYTKNELPEMLFCKTEADYQSALDSVIHVDNNVEAFTIYTVYADKVKTYTWEDAK